MLKECSLPVLMVSYIQHCTVFIIEDMFTCALECGAFTLSVPVRICLVRQIMMRWINMWRTLSWPLRMDKYYRLSFDWLGRGSKTPYWRHLSTISGNSSLISLRILASRRSFCSTEKWFFQSFTVPLRTWSLICTVPSPERPLSAESSRLQAASWRMPVNDQYYVRLKITLMIRNYLIIL